MDTASAFVKRVGGAPSLDFINTVRGRVSAPGPPRGKDFADRIVGERLDSYAALLNWTEFAHVMTSRETTALAHEAAARPAEAAAVLRRARRLREAMYRVFKAAIEKWTPRPADLETFNRELRAARAHERLVAEPAYRFEWSDARGALDRMLWPVVRSAAELLTSPSLGRVGQCPGDACGWLFLDTSRSGRRQWCDMSDCGNVAKVRRFREKVRVG